MNNSTTHTLSISNVKKYFPQSQWVCIEDDFCMINVRCDRNLHALAYPCRFDGILVLYSVKGRVRLSVNLDEYEIGEQSLFVTMPNNILRVTDVSEQDPDDMHYVVIAMSQKFASDLRIDFKRFMNGGMVIMDIPVVRLQDVEIDLLTRYMELAGNVVKAAVGGKDDAVRLLLSSMFCVIGGAWSRKMAEAEQKVSQVSGRSRMVFEQFIRLVGEYHTVHRNVGFYADKLCLTPKYLSKLIKNATGRSAPEWIDSYVILESKNLLKYSDMAIKEIVYRLNFPNQSVFYKFFKARTGMTPTQYRNS